MVLAAQLGLAHGYVHPAAHLHQFEIDARKVAGVGVDLNNILKPQFRPVGLGRPVKLGLPHLCRDGGGTKPCRGPRCICRNTYRLVGYRRPKKSAQFR